MVWPRKTICLLFLVCCGRLVTLLLFQTLLLNLTRGNISASSTKSSALMLCVATVITWLWFCRVVCSHKVIHLSGLPGYWWYRGIIHIQSTEANASFTQVDGWVSPLQVSPVRRRPDEVDGWRKASFFPPGLWTYCIAWSSEYTYSLSWRKSGGFVNYWEESAGRKKRRGKERIGPAHFSWHWLTCSYTIEQWCQAGKISPLLHGKFECQTNERERWRAGERGVKWPHFVDGVRGEKKGSRITTLLFEMRSWIKIRSTEDQLKVTTLADKVSFFSALKRKCEMEVRAEKSGTQTRRERKCKRCQVSTDCMSGQLHLVLIMALTRREQIHTGLLVFVIRTIIQRYEFSQTHTERSPATATTSSMIVPPTLFKTKATH